MQLMSLKKQKKIILSLLSLNLVSKYCWTLQATVTFPEILGPISS